MTTQGISYIIGMGSIAILSNITYAGMRAQNKPENDEIRCLAFIGGLPHTVISYFVVKEGSERAYGIELPKKQQSNDNKMTNSDISKIQASLSLPQMTQNTQT